MNVKNIHSRILQNISLLSSMIEVLARVRESISIEKPADIYNIESDSESISDCESASECETGSARTLVVTSTNDMSVDKPSHGIDTRTLAGPKANVGKSSRNANKGRAKGTVRKPKRTMMSAIGPQAVHSHLQAMFAAQPRSLIINRPTSGGSSCSSIETVSPIREGPIKKAPPRRIEEKEKRPSILRRVSKRNYYIEQAREESMRKEISFEEYLLFCSGMYETIARFHTRLTDTYYLTTVGVILKCMTRSNDEQALTDEYGRILGQCNVFNIIGYLVREIQYLAHYIEDNTASNDIMSDISMVKFKALSIKNDIMIIDNTIKFGECCGAQMIVLNETSELVCGNCNKVKKIDGILMRDNEYKVKHGSYDSMRHYKFWIDHIQGKDTQVFEDSFLAKLKAHLMKVQPNEKLLTYEQVRRALKHPSIGATKINNYISLLLRKMGGPACPILNYDENSLASFRFSRIMCLFVRLKEERVIDAEGKKKPYYPYFIYKILEDMLWTSPKLRILNYIYLQSRKTIIKNDNIYKHICSAADPRDGLKYKPTDHVANMAQIERNMKMASNGG